MTTDTTVARGKPPTEEDARTAAEAAAENFLSALRRAIQRLPESPDLNGAAGELTEVLARIGADATPVLTAASTAVGIFWSRDRAIRPETRRDDAAAHLPAVVGALDAVQAKFDRQGDLDQARAAVARLNGEQARLMTALEGAVGSGDVDRVLQLRPEVEVRLPAAMDAARLELVTLELVRVEASLARPQRRAQVAARDEQQAQAALTEAQQRLERAQGALQAVALVRFTAETRVAQVAQQARGLEAEIDRLREENSRSLAERLRRLAGLPEAPITNNHMIGDAR